MKHRLLSLLAATLLLAAGALAQPVITAQPTATVGADAIAVSLGVQGASVVVWWIVIPADSVFPGQPRIERQSIFSGASFTLPLNPGFRRHYPYEFYAVAIDGQGGLVRSAPVTLREPQLPRTF
jgi:hypothetical protein